MNENEEIKDIFKASFEVKAPGDLLDNVMEELNKPFVYKPIIGKRMWVFLAAIFLGFLVVSLFIIKPSSSGIDIPFDFTVLKNIMHSDVYTILGVLVLSITSLWFLNAILSRRKKLNY